MKKPSVRILGTGSHFPRRRLANEEISTALKGKFSPEEIWEKTGIRTRFWADDESLADMAVAAAEKAILAAKVDKKRIGRIFFANSTGGDALLPPTSTVIQGRLGLDAAAFDLNNACVGFLTAFEWAARAVDEDDGLTLVLAAENLSRFLNPCQPRSYVLFGDGAAGLILGKGGPEDGILASHFVNDGSYAGAVSLPNKNEGERILAFHKPNEEIKDIVTDKLVRSIDRTLSESGVRLRDIEWFLPHQPTGLMVKNLLSRLGIPKEKTFLVVEEQGSLGCVSMPAALDRLYRSGQIKQGDRILFAGVGVGLGIGSILYQVGSS